MVGEEGRERELGLICKTILFLIQIKNGKKKESHALPTELVLLLFLYYLDILGYSQGFLFGIFYYDRSYTMAHGIDAEANQLLSMLIAIVYLGPRVCLPHVSHLIGTL